MNKILLYLVICAAPLFANNPFDRALVLNGDGQFFQVPDSMCAALANAEVLSVEIRFNEKEDRRCTLLNKWQVFPTNYDTWSLENFKGHGWLVDLNTTNDKIEGKIEYTYMPPLEGFWGRNAIRLTHAAVYEDGWGCATSISRAGRLSSEKWHHLVYIIESRDQHLFFDGVRLDGGGRSSERTTLVPGYPLNVGGHVDSVDATLDLSAYFLGEVDELRIWNRILSVEEINARMNDTLSADIYASAESGLIGYYRFEELEDLEIGNDGLANDVRDLSVSANHGNVWNGGRLTEKSVETKMTANYEIPVTYELYQNFPNPFNPSTQITFDLPEAGPVDIKVFDIRGRLVATIVDNMMDAGSHSIQWANPTLPSGIYICRMTSNSFDKTIKMVLQK